MSLFWHGSCIVWTVVGSHDYKKMVMKERKGENYEKNFCFVALRPVFCRNPLGRWYCGSQEGLS